MHACQLLYFSLLAAISYASSGCQKDPYEPISQVEFGYLKGLLSRYVRPMPAGDFTKQSPRKSDFRKRDMPPQGTGNLGFADDGPFLSTSTTPVGGSADGFDERSVSERVYSNWCTVVTNTCIPEANDQDKIAGLLWMIVNHGEPNDQNIRRNAILEMLKETQTAGAITFKDVYGLTKLKTEPSMPGPKDDVTLNVAMRWRDNILPPGMPKPKLVIKQFPPPKAHVPHSSPRPPRKPHHKRLYRPSLSKPKPCEASVSPRSILHPRDDPSDNFCFPLNLQDWHILLLQLFQSIVLERLAPPFPPSGSDPSKSPTALELDIVHPGVGGKYDIVSGGQVRLKFWLSDSGPDYNGLRGAYFGSADAAPNSLSDEPGPGGSEDQTCYENYIAAAAAPDAPGPSLQWKQAFSSACRKAFGAKDLGDEKLPQPFHFNGPGPAPTKANANVKVKADGRGWTGQFIPSQTCTVHYSCAQITDLLDEHITFCANRQQNRGIYHGGVKHLRTVRVEGVGSQGAGEEVNCGTMRLEPVGVRFTGAF